MFSVIVKDLKDRVIPPFLEKSLGFSSGKMNGNGNGPVHGGHHGEGIGYWYV